MKYRRIVDIDDWMDAHNVKAVYLVGGYFRGDSSSQSLCSYCIHANFWFFVAEKDHAEPMFGSFLWIVMISHLTADLMKIVVIGTRLQKKRLVIYLMGGNLSRAKNRL